MNTDLVREATLIVLLVATLELVGLMQTVIETLVKVNHHVLHPTPATTLTIGIIAGTTPSLSLTGLLVQHQLAAIVPDLVLLCLM